MSKSTNLKALFQKSLSIDALPCIGTLKEVFISELYLPRDDVSSTFHSGFRDYKGLSDDYVFATIAYTIPVTDLEEEDMQFLRTAALPKCTR